MLRLSLYWDRCSWQVPLQGARLSYVTNSVYALFGSVKYTTLEGLCTMQGLCGTVCRHPISSLLLVLRVLCWVFPISIHLLYASFQHFHGKAAGAFLCS